MKFERPRRDVCDYCFKVKNSLASRETTSSERQKLICDRPEHRREADRRYETLRFDSEMDLLFLDSREDLDLPRWLYIEEDEDDIVVGNVAWMAAKEKGIRIWAHKIGFSKEEDRAIFAIVHKTVDEELEREVYLLKWEDFDGPPNYQSVKSLDFESYDGQIFQYQYRYRYTSTVLSSDYKRVISLPSFINQPSATFFSR